MAGADVARFLRGARPLPNAPTLAERAARGFFRPSRARLDEALAVAAAAPPGGAWEALAAAGLVPDSWVDDPARGFVGESFPWVGVYVRDSKGFAILSSNEDRARWRRARLSEVRGGSPGDAMTFEWAPSIGQGFYRPLLQARPSNALAAALAADAGTVPLAEELALESVRRLVPWGARPPRRVGWVLESAASEVNRVGMPFFSALDVAFRAVNEAATWRVRSEVSDASSALVPHGETTPDGAARWNPRGVVRFAMEGHALWGRMGSEPVAAKHGALRRRRFRDLPDPFVPVLELAALGYWTTGGVGHDALIRAPAPGEWP